MTFVHDGLRDSLTGLAAPPYFYENLRREIAISNRSGKGLTIIRFVLDSDLPLYAATIISFADLITNSFRYEDVKARLGVFEFGVLVQGGEDLAGQLCQRLVSRWALEGTRDSSVSYAYAINLEGEEAIALINRLDDQKLIRSDF